MLMLWFCRIYVCMYKMGFVTEAKLELELERGWVGGVGCVKVRVGWVSGGLEELGGCCGLRETGVGENERLKGRWDGGGMGASNLYVRHSPSASTIPALTTPPRPRAGAAFHKITNALLTVRSGLVYLARGP